MGRLAGSGPCVSSLPARLAALPAAQRAALLAGLSADEMAALLDLWRAECRRSLLPWTIEALAPQGHAPARHHRLLIDKLEQVAAGEITRLLVLLPPGAGKSTYTTKLLPPWWMARFPGAAIIGASHGFQLAEDFSREIHRIVRDNAETLGYGLTTERTDRWRTTNGGEYLAAGVGVGIAGFRSDLAIIDDPFRSRADADSETTRDKVWGWYNGDLVPRLKPAGRVVLIHTRWHTDDLAGRLLETQPGAWSVLKLPALAEDADDPLGRREGEPLWADDAYGYGGGLVARRAELEAAGALREWASLYQQRPAPAGGAMFRPAAVKIVTGRPAGGRWCRAWDLAASSGRGDWTAGVLLHATDAGQWTVADVVRLRGDSHEVEQAITSTAALDGADVAIALAQDPGQAGKSQVAYLTGRLSGYRVISSPETGSKETRAMPVASQVNAGNVVVVAGVWNRPFLDEMGVFPAGKNDDQVDALSRAFGVLLTPVTKPARWISHTEAHRRYGFTMER